nr:hypothetical protein [Tanacetum cinerariifolium]
MALTFADTYNMITCLTKLDASEGFEQILDFLNASVITYALTVNPTIYVSCIKQFWSSVSLKKTNDVVRLQDLIDRKKVIITEEMVRKVLRLDDAKSIDCLPDEEIFDALERMGLVRNVDSSSKFYMYPRFIQLMIAAQVGDISSHTTKYTSPALIQKVFANMRRVRKGFSGVDTPLFEGMLVPQQAHDDVATDDVADDVVDVVANADTKPTPPLPTPATTPPLPQQEVASTPPPSPHQSPIAHPSSPPTQQPPSDDAAISMDLLNTLSRGCIQIGEIIPEIDANEDVILEEVDTKKDAEVAEKDTDAQGRLEESQAQVYDIDLEHADKVLSMQDDETEPAELKEVMEVVTTVKLMTEVVTATATTITAAPITAAPSAARRRKGVVIKDPKETSTPSIIVHSESKSMVKGKGILVEEPKPLKKQAQIEQDEAYARKLEHFNFIVGFLEKSEKELKEEASKALKRKSESSKEKAAKKQNLDEEVEELKTHLQIVPNDEDDVYTEATPLALKVPIVDYQIHTEHNKPYYKIIRVVETHQLFLSFISLLRNFNKEDLEMLWQIVQEIFASLKPKNFSDDFLLNTLKAMFEKPNVEASIWKSQRGSYGLAKVKSWKLLESCGVHIITFTTTHMILLVDRRYLLARFTLDQMLNNVRLEVKEESEVSLELFRFVRRQQQEGYRPE